MQKTFKGKNNEYLVLYLFLAFHLVAYLNDFIVQKVGMLDPHHKNVHLHILCTSNFLNAIFVFQCLPSIDIRKKAL